MSLGDLFFKKPPAEVDSHPDITHKIRGDLVGDLVAKATDAGASEAIVILNWPDDIGVGAASGNKVRFITMIMGLVYRVYGTEGMELLHEMHESIRLIALSDPAAPALVEKAMDKLIKLANEDTHGVESQVEEMVKKAVHKAFFEISKRQQEQDEHSSGNNDDEFSDLSEIDLDKKPGH